MTMTKRPVFFGAIALLLFLLAGLTFDDSSSPAGPGGSGDPNPNGSALAIDQAGWLYRGSPD